MNIQNASIKVPIAVLKESAEKLLSLADENEDVFDRIYNSLQSMEASSEWKGESLTAAVTATQENRKKFSDTIDEMHKLAAFLKNYADDMATKDAELKRRIESVG